MQAQNSSSSSAPMISMSQFMRHGWLSLSVNWIYSPSAQYVAKPSFELIMARSQNTAHNPLQYQDTIAEQEQQVDSLMTEKQPWKGIMKGQNLDILLASTLLTLPMSIFGIALNSMVHMYQMPDQDSTYSTGNRTGVALGSAYYVNISSSRLANISSIASTVSMLLMSAAMVLYSYPSSRRLTGDCDRHRESTLPSPYQLTIMVKLVSGQPLALWSYVKYARAQNTRGSMSCQICLARCLSRLVS